MRVVASGKAAALVLPEGTLVYVVTLVFASNVHEVEAFVTLADVTAKGVEALPEPGAGHPSCGAFVDIHTGPPVRSQPQARRGALASDLSFDDVTAILTVCHGACQGACAGAVGHRHVAAEAEALVAAECVHAAVLAGPWLQATLVQVLIAGLAGISRVTLALVRPDTFSVLALRVAHGLTLSPGAASPAPAAVNPPTIATEADRGHEMPGPPPVEVGGRPQGQRGGER